MQVNDYKVDNCHDFFEFLEISNDSYQPFNFLLYLSLSSQYSTFVSLIGYCKESTAGLFN